MIDLLTAISEFLSDPIRWSLTERPGIPYRILEHLVATGVSLLIAIAIALPPAVWLAHHHRAEALAGALVNIGRAIPSFGLIVVFWLLASRAGINPFWSLVGALVALAIPPIFTTAYTGVAEVDAVVVEAARGQGFQGRQVLRQVELPLATPVILAGIRISLVQVIATVGIGAIVTDGGGVGRFVIDGFAAGAGGHARVFVGAVLMAALVLVAEALFGLAERRMAPVRSMPTDVVTDEVRAPV